MLQGRREVAIVLLGFRIGQLLEIYKVARVWPPAVAVLIPDLHANLELAVRECGFEQDVATTIRGMVDQQLALFGDATRLIEWAGGDWLFDQLRNSCSGLETTIRSVVSKRECSCLQIGVLLGKSFGEPPSFLEGPTPLPRKPSGNASWNYRSSDQLKSNLASLQLDIEQISGLPLDIPAFVAQLDPDDERYLRYPANHWGWVIIEERLITLRPESASVSPPSTGLSNQLCNEEAAVGATKSPDKPTSATALAEESRASLKEPTKEAFAAYRVNKLLGKNQSETAEILTKELHYPISQGQVSRWCAAVKKWIEAGGLLPMELREKANVRSVDPRVLDMGQRTDGRTQRQREKRKNDG